MFTRATPHANLRRPGRTRAVIAGGAALVLAGAALAACSGSVSSSAPARAAYGAVKSSAGSGQHLAASAPKGAEVGFAVPPAAPLIVRTGSLTIQLKAGSVTRVFDQISEQANALGGYVSSSATTGITTASLVLRVPSNEFSKLVDQVSSDGHMLSQQLNGQDVTGETINLGAQVTNLTAEEESLRSLMSRAGSIPSILEVQDQLFNVEGEIEQLTAEESSLVNQATFSTLDVSLQTAAPGPVHRSKGQGAIGRAVSLARRNTVAVVRGVLVALGWAFPAAVAALVTGGVLWVRRRRRMGGTGADAGPAPVAAP